MSIIKTISHGKRIEAIEAEISRHTEIIAGLDMYLKMLETALILAQVFKKEDFDKLRTEVLSKVVKAQRKVVEL